MLGAPGSSAQTRPSCPPCQQLAPNTHRRHMAPLLNFASNHTYPQEHTLGCGPMESGVNFLLWLQTLPSHMAPCLSSPFFHDFPNPLSSLFPPLPL